jgi:NAD(P)-dependent dehydrogenase (short-subunit alcohol dehydrogenase family)
MSIAGNTITTATPAYGETLAIEVAPLGVRVLTLIPGGFHTLGGKTGAPVLEGPASAFPSFKVIDDYAPLRARAEARLAGLPGTQPGDPNKLAELLVDVVRGEGVWKGREWPAESRLVVGSDSEADVKIKIASMEKSMSEYEDIVRFTDLKAKQ